MVGNSLLEVGQVQVLPGSRLILLAGVSPRVAVVEINHHIHPQGSSCLGLLHYILLVAPVIVRLRVNPYAQADGIKSQLLHQRRTFALLASGIVEFIPLLVVFSVPADVGSLGKIHLLGR